LRKCEAYGGKKNEIAINAESGACRGVI
jgi:hypothetical protein